MTPSDSPSPRILLLIGVIGLLVATGAGIYIGLDLYRGFLDGAFTLVRGKPITINDGFRYWLTAFGEGIGVMAMLFGAGLMVRVIIEAKKLIGTKNGIG